MVRKAYFDVLEKERMMSAARQAIFILSIDAIFLYILVKVW
jgi:hypothetical protein